MKTYNYTITLKGKLESEDRETLENQLRDDIDGLELPYTDLIIKVEALENE